MRRRLVIPALIALLAAAWGTNSFAETVQNGNLRINFNADFTPHVLPREQAAPVKVEVKGQISTTDGSHPPPLRWLEVKLNRNGKLYSKGLPACTAPTLQSTSSETALARCGGALVGRGSFHAEVKLGREIAAAGKILAFNSKRRRQTGAAAPPLRRGPGSLHPGRAAEDRTPPPGPVRDRAEGENPTARRRPRLGHRNRADDRAPVHLCRPAPQLHIGVLQRSVGTERRDLPLRPRQFPLRRPPGCPRNAAARLPCALTGLIHCRTTYTATEPGAPK